MEEIFILLVALLFITFIFFLANLAERNRERAESPTFFAAMSYLTIGGIYALLFFFGLMLYGAAEFLPDDASAEIAASFEGMLNEDLDFQTVLSRLSIVGLGLWIPSLIGLLLLVPIVRRAVAQLINIDPRSPVHAVALSVTMLIVIQLMFTLGIGLENLADMASTASENAPADENGLGLIATLWVQQLGTAFLGLVGIGWALRRDWSTSLQRLGITRITAGELRLGIGLGLVMVPVVMLLEFTSRTLLGIGTDPGVEALTEELLGPLMQTPLGIATIGLSAAIGEETIFRGAAQPRFGLILTAIIFAIVHSNYGLTISTAIVFLLGLVLGYIRLRHNTTTAMVIHAVYNSTLGLMAYLSLPFIE